MPLKLLSVFEASCSAFHAVLDQIRPHKRNHSSIVVAVRQIVIQRGKTMLLAGFFMPGELPVIEFVPIDVSPIVSRGVHGEKGSHGPGRSYNDVVLASATVPLSTVPLAIDCMLT